MSKLDSAITRLNAAMDALEAKLSALPSEPGTAPAGWQSERAELMARVARLEEERSLLAHTNEDIERRLDSTIAEIRSALG